MRTSSRIAILVMASLLALPTLALSKEHDRGGGHSGKQSSGSFGSRGQRDGAGRRERSTWSRGGAGGGSRERNFSRNTETRRERGWGSRESAARDRSWRPSAGISSERSWGANGGAARDRGWSRSSGERVFRTPSPGRVDRGDRGPLGRIARGEVDWRSTRRDAGSGRGSGRDRGSNGYGDGGQARYKPSGPIIQRGGGGGYRGGGNYRARRYYTNDFYRPRYIERSGFSIGFSIGAYPAYGYRYYDPYCGIAFASLDSYYGHCHSHSHPSAILVIDYQTQAPIATCIYADGDWVVDDCAYDDSAYDDRYDDGPQYDDRQYDDRRYDDEYYENR